MFNVRRAPRQAPRVLQIMTQISLLDLFLAAFLLLTAANRETHWCLPGFAPLHENGCVRKAASLYQLMKPQTHQPHLFCKYLFFAIMIWADSWQAVHPQPQSINLSPHLLSLNSLPALLIKQCWLSGRISSAWRSPAVRPERSEKKIWGARLSALWSVIPQINMKIMCKVCMPIMLFHFFQEGHLESGIEAQVVLEVDRRGYSV